MCRFLGIRTGADFSATTRTGLLFAAGSANEIFHSVVASTYIGNNSIKLQLKLNIHTIIL